LLPGDNIISQLHDVVEVILSATDLQNIDKPIMRTRDRFELLDPIELALEGPRMFEGGAINDLHRAIRAHDIARQPDFAVAALANAPDQFVIADFGGSAR